MSKAYIRSDIVAIVVTFNRKLLLKEALEALLNQSIICDIYIIDNCSTDGTRDMLHQYLDKKNIKYFNTGSNLGGAGGFHYGLNEAAKAGYTYAWLMDDDTIVSEKALEEFTVASHTLKDNFGFLCSYVQWTDNNPCKMNIPSISKKWIYYLKSIGYGLIPLESASFVSFFIKMKTVHKIGLPYKEFFIWADDVEFSLRISNNYPSFLVSKSVVTHKMINNLSTSISFDENRLNRYRICYRNRFFLSKKHKKLLNFTKCVIIDILEISKNNRKDKIKKIGIILKGIWDGFFFHPIIDYPSCSIDKKDDLY